MDMSEDNYETPDRPTNDRLTKEFVEITGTNEALAHSFLQEHEWNLNKSVCAYYESLNDKKEQKTKTSSIDFSSPKPNATQSKQANLDYLYNPFVVETLFGKGKVFTNEPPPRMKLLTWNLNGLSVKNLKKRTRAVIRKILEHEPDIVFFQEVITESADYFESKLPEYKCIRGGDEDYFTMTLLRVFTIYYDNNYIVDFPNSKMGRNLLVTEAHVGKLKLKLLNTHLESTREHSSERQNQLKCAFDKCKSFESDCTVIFGGDLNLRDDEARVPENFFDLWEYCGSPKVFKYTWDMTRNTSDSMNFGRFKPRCRFDRVYFRFSSPKRAYPTHFALTGAEKIPQTQSFASDHWGIIVLFRLDHSV